MITHDIKLLRILGLALVLLATRDAFGDDTMNIRVYNGFAWFPALVTPGFEGSGHVRWSAETTGTSFHRCGHAERGGLANDSMLHVFTDSDCVKGDR
jgi:hypothetical protein